MSDLQRKATQRIEHYQAVIKFIGNVQLHLMSLEMETGVEWQFPAVLFAEIFPKPNRRDKWSTSGNAIQFHTDEDIDTACYRYLDCVIETTFAGIALRDGFKPAFEKSNTHGWKNHLRVCTDYLAKNIVRNARAN